MLKMAADSSALRLSYNILRLPGLSSGVDWSDLKFLVVIIQANIVIQFDTEPKLQA